MNVVLTMIAGFFGGVAILTAFGSAEPWILGPCAYLAGVFQVIAIARASR